MLLMHATNSKENQPSTSYHDSSLVQSTVNRSEIFIGDEHTDEEQAYSQFHVTGDSSSLYWAVTLAYLIPVKDKDYLFAQRYQNLFGKDKSVVKNMGPVRKSIRKFNPFSRCVPEEDDFDYLVRNKFRNRVVDFIDNNLDRFEYFPEVAQELCRFNMRSPDTWGGDPEIQGISLLLNCCINVDEHIFPLISNNDPIQLERITLKLFRANRSSEATQKESPFNYGLEKCNHEHIREILIDYTIEFIGGYMKACQNSTTKVLEQHKGKAYKDPLNNSSGNSKKFPILKEKKNVQAAYKVVNKYVAYKVSFEVKFETICLYKLSHYLGEYCQYYKEKNEPVYNSIRKLCELFWEPKHVGNIFRILTNSKENELLKCAFTVLKYLIDELYKNEYYDVVYNIANVREVISTKDLFLQMNRSDLDVLQLHYIAAQTMIKKGLHEQALEMLNGGRNAIMNVGNTNISCETSIDNKESKIFHLSLLISSDIAFTKHMMSKHEESYKEYTLLHDKIMKHIGITRDASRLSYSIYKEILKSRKYHDIQAFNKECLSILHIRENIARELECLGSTHKNNLEYSLLKDYARLLNVAVEYYQFAINLHEDTFGIKRIYAESHYEVGKIVQCIAVDYNMLADLTYNSTNKGQYTIESLNAALKFYYKALEMYSVRITNPFLCPTHPVSVNFAKDVSYILENIAIIHRKCGTLKLNTNLRIALRHFEKALYIFENLHKYMMSKSGEEFSNTMKMKKEIYSIKQKVDDLKSRLNAYKSE